MRLGKTTVVVATATLALTAMLASLSPVAADGTVVDQDGPTHTPSSVTIAGISTDSYVQTNWVSRRHYHGVAAIRATRVAALAICVQVLRRVHYLDGSVGSWTNRTVDNDGRADGWRCAGVNVPGTISRSTESPTASKDMQSVEYRFNVRSASGSSRGSTTITHAFGGS